MGEPDLGLYCLVMVGNNELYLWQEQIKVNISDFLIWAQVHTIEVQIQTGYSKWGCLIWVCTVWSWLATLNYNYGKNKLK